MKVVKMLAMGIIALVTLTSLALAGDFDWLKDLNIKAEANPSGFKAELSGRFKVGNAEISAVISNVEKPADAYMVLRLGELSNQPPDVVLKQYQAKKGQGWGALAKSLGIKPGSREFHELKRGHDLSAGNSGGKGKGKGKNKGHGRN